MAIASISPAQQKSDSELFAEGRIALDKYKDCPTAKNSFEAESVNAQDSAVWLDYAARASECAGFLDVALSYYERESKKLPATARLIDKIGDLQYRINVQNDRQAQADAQRAEQNAKQAAVQAADGPSLEETLAYINSHSGGITTSVSFEKGVLSTEHFSGDCGRFCHDTTDSVELKVISSLTVGRDGFDCAAGKSDCIDHIRLIKRKNKVVDRYESSFNGIQLIFFNDLDGDQIERLGKAMKRLLFLVDQRYQLEKRQRTAEDPFK